MSWLLDNPDREYIESVKTDVMKTWRKFGFVPPSELKTGIQTTKNTDSDNKNGTQFYGDILNAVENLHQVQDK